MSEAEWTPERLLQMGYESNPDPAAAQRTATDARIDRNARHRESLLPCSRSAGQPLAEKEVPAPVAEVDRLFPDHERIRGVLEARRAAGIV